MSGSPPPGGVAEIFTLAVPGLRAVIIQVVVPGAPTRAEAEGVYSPLLTLMAFAGDQDFFEYKTTNS